MVTEKDILDCIIRIRDKKVMIDRDLALIYGVTTKRLNEQVKRNMSRFPADFVFELTKDEKGELVANCDRFLMLRHSTTLPYAFTEHGAVMLACILNSEKAIQANIQIVRVFTAIREMALLNKDLLLKMEKIEQKLGIHDKELAVIFSTLKKMLEPKPIAKRNQIGFRRDENE
jgi:hypothetical protein